MKLRLLIVLFLLLSCLAMADHKGVAQVPLPADLTGTLNGAEYKIRVPSNWNGALLVFAHGVQNAGIKPEIAPVTWPAVTPSLEDRLLGMGYALAGSGFQNSDKDGVQQTLALTKYFKKNIGHPNRIIIWGNSLGAGITLKLIERYPEIYDGAVANCAVDAGTPENMDQALAFGLAYSAAFGWHDDAWGPVEDVKDGLSFKTEVLPILLAEASPGPTTFGRWEFIRLVMHQPQESFWLNDSLNGAPFFLLQMWKTTERRAAIEAEDGGPIAPGRCYGDPPFPCLRASRGAIPGGPAGPPYGGFEGPQHNLALYPPGAILHPGSRRQEPGDRNPHRIGQDTML